MDRRAGSPIIELPPQEMNVATFAKGLGKTWQTGERRTIHRRPYVRRKPLARRPSMLDAYVARIEEWLTANPTSRPLPLWTDFTNAHQAALTIGSVARSSAS